MLIVFVFLVGAAILFGIPIIVHLVLHGFKTHHISSVTASGIRTH